VPVDMLGRRFGVSPPGRRASYLCGLLVHTGTTQPVRGFMSSYVTALRPSRGKPLLARAHDRDRWTRRRLATVWGLLILNTIGFSGAIVHVPSVVGKGVTQGALPIALLVALAGNPRVMVRPNVFLCLVSLLVLEAILTCTQAQYVGTIYRTFRLAEFVAVLWLLSPWWGRRDLVFVRFHLIAYAVILGSVVLGLVVAPSQALVGGRLGGAIWTIPPTQVAHYAAVTIGLLIVLWFCGLVSGRLTLLVAIGAGGILVFTHTRTALMGMIAGVLVAGMSLIMAKARVRKLFVAAGVIVAIVIMTLSSFITTWLARGQTGHLADLTGRTQVWTELLATPRARFQEIFGFGLSNSSFNGLPIDSNWLSSYQEQGLFGVTVCAAILLFLLVTAYFRPRGAQRALALFLLTYCLVASFTEDGFTDATTYLLELMLAASMLVPALTRGNRQETRARPSSPTPSTSAAAKPRRTRPVAGAAPDPNEERRPLEA
jgi:O-Antigen ligase